MDFLYGRITVPVDGSSASAAAVDLALDVAKGGGRLRFISVVDPTAAYIPACAGAGGDPAAMLGVLEEQARGAVADAMAQARAAQIPCEGAVLHGLVEDAIVVDLETGVDAAIMGTHGRSGIARALLGSVAESVLRRAVVPVLFAHESDGARRGPVIAAVDGSPAAAVALDTALNFARAWGSPTVFVHVTGADERDESRSLPLQEAAQRARDERIDVVLSHRHGDTITAVIQAAEEYDAALIVAGTRGRSAAERIVAGSVACRLVERAQIPVLIVKAAARAAVEVRTRRGERREDERREDELTDLGA